MPKVTSFIAALLFGSTILVVSVATAAPLVMTINRDESSLTFSGQTYDENYPFLEQGAGSKTTSYTGTITVDVDSLVSPTAISILSANADADGNGTWLPKIGGQTSPIDNVPTPAAEADYGYRVHHPTFNLNVQFGAVRNLVWNISSPSQAIAANGLFNSNESLNALSGLWDIWVRPGFSASGGGSFDMTEYFYARNISTPTMSSYTVAGNTATLTIPIRAKHVFDSDNFETVTGTLVATATVLLECPVESLNQALIPHPDPPPLQYLYVNDLSQRVEHFQELIQRDDPQAIIEVESAYRSPEYQAHFLDIKRVWDSFTDNRDQKVQNAIDIVNGQLKPNADDPQHQACLACIAEVNHHKSIHGLGINSKKRLAVNEDSDHTKGTAVDISVDNSVLSQDRIGELAALAGLRRPYYPGNDHEKTHFVMSGTPVPYGAQVEGHSPVNLLIEDSLGRRLGFDPSINQIVNDFGPYAEYSGPGTEPQVLKLPYGTVINGGYKISGIGTGDGSYTIRSFLYGDDPDSKLDEKVLLTGVARLGEPLPEVNAQLLSEIGDFTTDGLVDDVDQNWWQHEFGAAVPQRGTDADGNGDGTVNAADYVVWRKSVGQLGSLNSSVPEPSYCLLLGAFLLYWPRSFRQAISNCSGARTTSLGNTFLAFIRTPPGLAAE